MEKEAERDGGRNGEGGREGERKGEKEGMLGRGRKTHNTYLYLYDCACSPPVYIHCYQQHIHNF